MLKIHSDRHLTPQDREEIEEYESNKKSIDRQSLLQRLDKNFKPNQKQQGFTQVIRNNTIIICHGSAGTGKTITALYQGLQEAVAENKRLVLIRPVFESASVNIGFLPGDIEDKLAPHTKPFMYTLDELIGYNLAQELIKQGKIRFELLNFLRGATLTNAVIICDEAQNMTVEEMILATTRIGRNSKIIFTGDFFQSDLRKARGSIMEFASMIEDIKGVSRYTFTSADVVRNPILVEVTSIWEAYKQKHKL